MYTKILLKLPNILSLKNFEKEHVKKIFTNLVQKSLHDFMNIKTKYNILCRLWDRST